MRQSILRVTQQISLSLMVLCIAFVSYAEPLKTITVIGEAYVSQQPDRFHFNLSIEEKGLHVSKLNKALSQKTEHLVKVLLESGVEEKHIQSLHIQIMPWYEYVNNQRENKGFRLYRQIKVSFDELDKFDYLIDRLVKGGATGIDGFNYSVSQPQLGYLQAVDLAMTNAALRAERIAQNVGAKIGQAVSVKELGSAQSFAPRLEKSMAVADSAGGFMPGEVDLHARVEVVFELEY
ncbi:SIMPL domain-containing protein [Alteromonas sp. a30]|uniref:SIMPL domain-containing protein n=1 Tax=Alteromonas sp. a30 TaxID=2730917 RepID=UPI0022801110|nr:SIMPL domain-containing protein [Alteromonas sp. a30]MCY7293916.1 SIMPL domain-containing protein [Alteromonas sp. a30]